MTTGGRWGGLVGIPWMVLAFSAGARAQSCEPAAASVISVQGDVDVSDSDRAHWRDVQLNQVLCGGQQVRLMAKSRAVLQLPNETLLHLDEGSVLTLQAVAPEKPAWLEFLRGALHIISRVPRALNIRTPFVNAGIEGTEFALRVDPAQAELWVYEGRVRFSNRLGQLLIASGEAAAAAPGRPPERRIVVKPRRAVEWALYYPPLLDTRPERYPEALRPAVLAYRQNDLTAAFARLGALPPKDHTGIFFTLRAALLLSVGRVEEAERDIATALEGNPKESTALALRAVIAVVRNETEEALRFAQEAVTAEPRSPTPYVARSYAEQSAFEIETARESLEKAAELAPEDALVWARLAEIELSLGDLDAALEAATKAEVLDPDLARTQTVLGFAYLTRIEVDEAQAAFDRAIARDPADPLPRLGMGLAKIRDGDVDEGTKEIEIAASLDPNNSLVRSYLGKAYYEQKRGGLAEIEFEQAKLLDPKDPTPWFYDAIHKQTTNRPVEALHDLEAAIERNDNRAVYRSRLLLDEDLAARGSTLARIYDDVGFEERALLESVKSLSLNPANHSAHRFLSDTYARLPRHEIAQVSELLQAQLLQPLNINPVQPRLSIKGVDMVSGIGPAEAAFNEFTPLFERNGPRFAVAGVAGNNDTYGDEAVLSGLLGRFSYSLGQFHHDTDGFRNNNDITHDIYNAFGQLALTDKVNVQLEYRHRDTEQGDVRLRLDPKIGSSNERRKLDHDIGRIGLHFAPSTRSDFIASFIYSDRNERLHNQTALTTQDLIDDEHGYEAEGQYLFRGHGFNLIVGGGAYRADVKSTDTTITPARVVVVPPTIITPPPPFPPIPILILGSTIPIAEATDTERDTFDIDGESAYFYTNVTFPANLLWTFGLSYDTYEQTSPRFKVNKLHPKLGLLWDITDWLRLRTAYIQTVKRPLLVDQTIEPTQVAGFNQFFDDFNGTQAELYGIGIDAVIKEKLYGGFELTRRDLSQPNTVESGGDKLVEFSERDEELYRAYLYWTPHPDWSLNTEYRHERDLLSFELETNFVPVTIRYFGPQGFFAQLGSTFVWQEKTEDNRQRLNDNFAIVDAAIGFRLPKRRGIVSVEVSNLLDEEFLFEDSGFKTSDQFNILHRFLPDRAVFARIVLNF